MLLHSSGPLNVTLAIGLWEAAWLQIWQSLAQGSLLHGININSSISLSYSGRPQINPFSLNLIGSIGPGLGFNTPGNDEWEMDLWVTSVNASGSYSQGTGIYYTPAGEIDTERTDIPYIVSILLPDEVGQQNATEIVLSLLSFVNWVVVSGYWLALYDAGQLTAVVYGSVWDEYSAADTPNLSDFIKTTSRYNIFVNQSLFQTFSDYMLQNVLTTATNLPNGISPQFLPLNDTNHVQPVDATVYRNFLCSERKIKGWFSLFISVFAADYAVVGGIYTIFTYVVGCIQKRKDTSSLLSNQFDRRKRII